MNNEKKQKISCMPAHDARKSKEILSKLKKTLEIQRVQRIQ